MEYPVKSGLAVDFSGFPDYRAQTAEGYNLALGIWPPVEARHGQSYQRSCVWETFDCARREGSPAGGVWRHHVDNIQSGVYMWKYIGKGVETGSTSSLR